MNFKRYHVSKNLCDESQLQHGYFGNTSPFNFTADEKYRCFSINLTAGTYTILAKSDSLIIHLLRVSSTTLGSNYVENIDNIPYAFTLPVSETIYVSLRNSTTTNDFTGLTIMLNTGSQPLPYEPYGNTWHDIPYYQHSTATDTLTLPARLYPNDTSITVGLKGNEEHTGTPTPDSPVMPQGTGERSSNLVEGYISGCNINASGDLISNADFNMFIAKVEQGKTYCLDTTITVAGYFTTMPTVGSVSYDAQRSPLTLSPFTAPIDGYLAYRKASSEKKAMMNEGNELLPYEPYGVKIPILSAGITTPVYLGEVESTRQIKKLVLTGEENWVQQSMNPYSIVNYALSVSGRDTDTRYIACTHYEMQTTTIADTTSIGIFNGSNIFIRETYLDINNFKNYLRQQYAAGTPVVVWYVLSSATTGIVNEPLMRIGDYADTVSNVSIPVTAGGDTLSVGTTVQPSEVTVNYKGWHPVQNVHERENGQWD